jgi:hypothetical protein
MFDTFEKIAFELTIGAMGYLLRKWYGEELSKYIFMPVIKKLRKYFFTPVASSIRKHLIKTQKEAAIWLHYRNKAHGHGHQQKNPIICTDGKCRLI